MYHKVLVTVTKNVSELHMHLAQNKFTLDEALQVEHEILLQAPSDGGAIQYRYYNELLRHVQPFALDP